MVVSEHRPVPLWQHVMVGTRMVDLFVDGSTVADASHAPGGAVLAARGSVPAGAGGSGGERGGERDGARPGPPTTQDGGPASDLGVNPELVAISRAQARSERDRGRPGTGGRRPAPETAGAGRRGGGSRAGGAPGASRPEVLERLAGADLLPAICFIFSRAGCAAAVAQCVAAGLRLTNRGASGPPSGRWSPPGARSTSRTSTWTCWATTSG